MMFILPTCRRMTAIASSRVVHAELDGGTAAVEGQDDHEVVAIIP